MLRTLEVLLSMLCSVGITLQVLQDRRCCWPPCRWVRALNQMPAATAEIWMVWSDALCGWSIIRGAVALWIIWRGLLHMLVDLLTEHCSGQSVSACTELMLRDGGCGQQRLVGCQWWPPDLLQTLLKITTHSDAVLYDLADQNVWHFHCYTQMCKCCIHEYYFSDWGSAGVKCFLFLFNNFSTLNSHWADSVALGRVWHVLCSWQMVSDICFHLPLGRSFIRRA